MLDSTLLGKATKSVSHNMKDSTFKESIRVRENLIKEFDDTTFYETLYHFFNTIEERDLYYNNTNKSSFES